MRDSGDWESGEPTHRQACGVECLLQLFTEAGMTAAPSYISHSLHFLYECDKAELHLK